MEMLDTTMGGRQRTERKFRRLFEQAGFELRRIVAVPAAPSFVEAVAV